LFVAFQNLAACELKTCRWHNVIDYCTRASLLDDGRQTKIYSRRAIAYEHVDELELSLADLNRVHKTAPTERTKQDVARMQQMITNNKSKQRNMFGGFFASKPPTGVTPTASASSTSTVTPPASLSTSGNSSETKLASSTSTTTSATTARPIELYSDEDVARSRAEDAIAARGREGMGISDASTQPSMSSLASPNGGMRICDICGMVIPSEQWARHIIKVHSGDRRPPDAAT
jgi:hypothetical protein